MCVPRDSEFIDRTVELPSSKARPKHLKVFDPSADPMADPPTEPRADQNAAREALRARLFHMIVRNERARHPETE